jgi:hypothetical protein
MSQADLDTLSATLQSIPATEVDEPDVPVGVVLQEATTLSELVKGAGVRAKLTATGLPGSVLEALPTAIGALSTAQAQWQNVRGATKAEDLTALEERAHTLRSRVVAAARFNLRSDRKAQATIDVIVEGDGVADLTQDLVDLAELLRTKTAAFASDTTFDAAARAAECQTVAEELRLAVATGKLTTTQAAALDLRNRAFTHLDDLTAQIRASGRYAYDGDRAMTTRFSSEYLRRKRARRSKATPPVA